MSQSILEQLKLKKTPSVAEKVKIKVNVRAKVIMNDERATGDVDREYILTKMTQPRMKPVEDAEKKAKKKKSKKPTIKFNIIDIESKTPESVVEPIPKSVVVPDPSAIERITPKPDMNITIQGTLTKGPIINQDILPTKKQQVILRASNYYLNNRNIFVTFINKHFNLYREEILKANKKLLDEKGIDNLISKCDRSGSFLEFELLTHQKIVRDYLNIYTPYRGLLLYHGLGSGKTCSSIAIAEGMKSTRQVIVMTPASLRRNYLEQLKECGDPLYVKNQFWKFVPLKSNEHLLDELSNILSISTKFIRAQGGAWMVNVKNPTNYQSLLSEDKNSLDKQITEMILHKYKFISYNGLRDDRMNELTKHNTINPFDNAVIVIDEAHNFISRIVNKIKKPESISMRLYEFLMTAKNARIVLLTGTPIINYPNEIGILFNILRGYIKTWTLPLNVKTTQKIDEVRIKKLMNSPELKGLIDYVNYKPATKELKFTRNPFGFKGEMSGRSYKGVSSTVDEYVSDDELITVLTKVLGKEQIEIISGRGSINRYKALPDTLDDFQNHFVDIKTSEIKNKKLFQRRILGLVSHFGDIKELMPAYETDKDLHVIRIPMSDYQFEIYENARSKERKLESQASKKKATKAGKSGLYDDSVSTYRIFSRAFCNFVFPHTIVRPMPQDGNLVDDNIGDEDSIDAVTVEEKLTNPDGLFTVDELGIIEKDISETTDITYESRIKEALSLLKKHANDFLTPEFLKTYSPKFLTMFENIIDPDNVGSHMVYSQFRTLEGIGILSIILDANGFSKFKLKKDRTTGVWELNMTDEELAKPSYAMYTGTEDAEEKEIIRNIYNSDWAGIPASITTKLKEMHGDNVMGNIIKLLMITASGAEGISLKNCRFVHVTEPYWHPVRVEQVIGRAARICSHKDLPIELRTVKVFQYLMTFSERQLTSDESIELRLKDKSKLDKKTPLTSDEALFEISNMKQEINKRLLLAVKEAAIDCNLHNLPGSKKPLVCFSFGQSQQTASKFAISPSLDGEETDVEAQVNIKKITWKAKEVRISGKLYALNAETNELYEYESYLHALTVPGADPTYIGKLVKNDDGTFSVEIM